jgi:putative toxin-antitoxin system antitoxin component (TIGR02293 family)
VSPRSIRYQYKKCGRLSIENTEKLVRIARVLQKALKIFSTNNAVSAWLVSPAPALGGTKPIDLLDIDIGARKVESILGGIAYGNVM